MRRFFSGRRKAFAASLRVEGNREAAQMLRAQEPHLYQWILAQANGDKESESLAQRDPDAWVAIFMASTKEEMDSDPARAPTASGSEEQLADKVGMSVDEWLSLSVEERHEALERAEEDARYSAERKQAAEELVNDPEYRAYVLSTIEKWNDLWGGPKNPLRRDAGEPGDIELATLHYLNWAVPVARLSAGLPNDDRAMALARFIMIGGYLWRQSEYEQSSSGDWEPNLEIAFSVESVNEDPTRGRVGDGTRAGLMAKAILKCLSIDSIAARSFGSFARDGYDGIALEDGCDAVVEFAEGLENVQANALLPEETLRAIFLAGVVLREVEPSYSSHG